MNDKSIKMMKDGKTITREICNYENDVRLTVTYDKGMGGEYRRQLGGNNVWITGGEMVFKTEKMMLDFASYFSNDGGLSKSRPATSAQIQYLINLNVKIEDGLTVERASQLIDAAKNNELGSVYGWNTDGSN